MGRGIILIANHRTGSSALAGVLHKLGCNMGVNLLGPTNSNPKGHFEDVKFLKHNQQVVGDWKKPRLYANDKQVDEYKRLVEIRDKYQRIWGMKDPRLCVTAKYVIPFCEEPKLLTITRPLQSSVQSMAKRDNLTEKEAKEILMIYENEKRNIFRTFRRFPLLTISYQELLTEPEKTIEILTNFIFDEYTLPSKESEKEAIEFIDYRLNSFGY